MKSPIKPTIIFLSLGFQIFLFVLLFVGSIVVKTPYAGESLREQMLLMICGVVLLLAAASALFKLSAKPNTGVEPLTREKLLGRTIVIMALAEVSALIALILKMQGQISSPSFWMVTGGAFLINLLVTTPQAVAHATWTDSQQS